MDKVISVIPVSAVIATRNRAEVLLKTLTSLFEQSVIPAEIIIIDASHDDSSFLVYRRLENNLSQNVEMIYLRSDTAGAASQRNEGVARATTEFILFLDDDIIFYPDCLKYLWRTVNLTERIGGVNAMIVNQQYSPPGRITRFMYRSMSGVSLPTYAGLCIGPAWNILPHDDHTLPECVPVEWLNTTCTLYRKAALPSPVFSPYFKDYSLLEDVSLSLIVGRTWELYNSRLSKIFHDSQPGLHKSNQRKLSKMEFENRFYVMTSVLGKKSVLDFSKLIIFEIFGVIAGLTGKNGWRDFFSISVGKFQGLTNAVFRRKKYI